MLECLQSHCTVLYTMHTAPPYTTPPLPQSLQADISGLGVEGVLSDESHSRELDAAICEHLFRQGRLDIGEMIIEVGSQGEGLSSLRSHDVMIYGYKLLHVCGSLMNSSGKSFSEKGHGFVWHDLIRNMC